MTEILCYSDSYLKEFDARVIDSTPKGVVLDRTGFFRAILRHRPCVSGKAILENGLPDAAHYMEGGRSGQFDGPGLHPEKHPKDI